MGRGKSPKDYLKDFSFFFSIQIYFSSWTISGKDKGFFRGSHPEVFLGKGVLKICSKFTGEHSCRSAISIKFLSNFIISGSCFNCSGVSRYRNFKMLSNNCFLEFFGSQIHVRILFLHVTNVLNKVKLENLREMLLKC